MASVGPMTRYLTILAKVVVAACVIVAEGLWSQYLVTAHFMREPYLTITIVANAATAVAASSVVLLLSRANARRIARTALFCIVGMSISVWAAGNFCGSPYDHGYGETALTTLIGGIVGACAGFVLSLVIIDRVRRP
jgi:hypothetical protein